MVKAVGFGMQTTGTEADSFLLPPCNKENKGRAECWFVSYSVPITVFWFMFTVSTLVSNALTLAVFHTATSCFWKIQTCFPLLQSLFIILA
jgi:hypothetical protein